MHVSDAQSDLTSFRFFFASHTRGTYEPDGWRIVLTYDPLTYLQGSFSSKESCDRCLTRSRVPVGPLSEKCTPNDRFLCGNVPPKFPPTLSGMVLLLSRRSSSSTSLSSR